MAAAPSTNTTAPTPRRRWLWLVVGVSVLVLVALYGVLSLRDGGLRIADRDANKRAAMELCWKEQATLKPGERLEGGACDRMERLFQPKIDAQAYGGS
ncbi:hypothetical protein [Variovorax ginsengisoli]|nr:hypothetical protein [Variovorax ginsengisoli]